MGAVGFGDSAGRPCPARLGALVAGCTLSLLSAAAAAQASDPPPGPADPPPGPASFPPRQPRATPPSPEQQVEAPPSVGGAAGLGAPLPQTAAAESSLARRRDPPSTPVAPPSAQAGSSAGIGVLGASGLMRVLSAGSGAPGSFRLALLTGLYSGTGFLCPPCAQDGEGLSLRDDVDNVTANLYLSATPLPYLEAYLAVYSHATSTNRPEPRLRQVVGDWSLGAKFFRKFDAQGIWNFGGNLDALFATGTGQVGAPGIGAASLALRGLMTADLSLSRSRLPVRGHVNLGYTFDNSGKLVESFESENAPLDRVQRFSLGINRVDHISFGLGAEGLLEGARPFVEWSVEVPANYRQSYRCSPRLLLAGDNCLEGSESFATIPSRLTVGVRAQPWESFPWWVDGLGVLAALDVGTGATTDFLAEVRPEVPWKLWVGVSYSVEPRPDPLAANPAPPAPTAPSARGRVVDRASGAPIANAQVRFANPEMTGLITTEDGQFSSAPLGADVYPLRVTAEGYQPGTCQADLRATAMQAPSGAALPTAAAQPGQEAGATPEITCQLEPLPQLASLVGYLIDSASAAPVSDGIATMTDTQGRPLSIAADERGAFGFENIVPGRAVLEVEAPGYLRSMTSLELQALQKLEGTVLLTAAPPQPRVRLAAGRVEFERPFEFNAGATTLTAESLGLLQELCGLLLASPPPPQLTVRSHAGDGGQAAQQLSEQRANVVRDLLILHGLESGQVQAEGVGNREPLVQGAGEAARRQNERLELRFVGQQGPSPSTTAAPQPATPSIPPSPIVPPALEPSKVLEDMLLGEPE